MLQVPFGSSWRAGYPDERVDRTCAYLAANQGRDEGKVHPARSVGEYLLHSPGVEQAQQGRESQGQEHDQLVR